VTPATTEPAASCPDGRVGEVVEAGTTAFTAEASDLHAAPPFGAFVRAGNGAEDVVAVVADSHTGSIDPGRRPIARGRDLADEAEVYRRNPELIQLLRTEFDAVVVGFRDAGGVWRPWLPGRPPRLHAFVYECSATEVAAFTAELDFLPTLLAATRGPVDELVGACLRTAGAARGGDRPFLVEAGKRLATLLAAEPHRLGAILRRIRP
jgi:hypothetical protein